DDKGPCSKCEVHCYKPQMRARVQAVMRYAGPRMMTRHPVMGLRHVVKSLKGAKRPQKK
ncbi:MAG: nitrous oxide-stimulated promoter family protein, partial [bacterium]|nr:nitrous oxide-stimulated promoter family protein [bacterium]